MSFSIESPIAEFDRYRFARNADGTLAELPAARRGERAFLVLDCLRHRLAELHLFEGAAEPTGAEDAFQEQMRVLSHLNSPCLTPLLSHGRDDTELFYVRRFIDGEPLGDYLRRTGGLPEAEAMRLALKIGELLLVTAPRPAALENFDLGHLMVTAGDHDDGASLRLHFSDYSGWGQPTLERPAMLVPRLALQLYNLLGGFVFRGAPSRLFVHEAGQTSPALRELLTAGLNESDDARVQSLASFTSALRGLLSETEDRAPAPRPHRFLEQWLTEGLGIESLDPGPDYRMLPETADHQSLVCDAFAERLGSRATVRFQLFPNWDSIPREGWLEQHHTALRRGGRSLPNQLGVTSLEPRGRCLLIGEEPVAGVSLETLSRARGPLEPEHAAALARKISSAIDVMEKTTGAAPVWWLPAGNVYLVTGDTAPESLTTAMTAHGPAAWQRLPVRLRLHQTANDLVEGLTFPDSLLHRANVGGKKGEAGRRSAVLLPLLWRLLTGEETMDWESPLECPSEVTISEQLLDTLESFRRRLIADPRDIHQSLTHELDRFIGTGDTVTFAESALGEGTVSEPVTLFETAGESHAPDTATLSPVPTAPATYLSSRPRRRSFAQRPDLTESGEIESLGSIEDPSFHLPVAPRADDMNAARSKSGGLSLTPFSKDNRSSLIEETPPPAVEESPKPVARKRLFFRRDPAIQADTSPKIDESSAPVSEPIESADDAPSTTTTTATTDWFKGFTDSREPEPESLPALEPEPLIAPIPDTEAEPMSFYSFLASESVPASESEALREDETPPTSTARLPLQGWWRRFRREPEKSSGQNTADPTTPTGERSPGLGQLAQWLGLAALLWGATYLLVSFAETVERQTLAETFTPLIQTDYLRGADPLGATPAADLPDSGDPAPTDPAEIAALADHHLAIDRPLGLQWLRKSAETGHPRHQRQLGLLLAEVPEQMSEAVLWLERAASQGDPEACLYYGAALLQGRGVDADPVAAHEYLQKAADTGDGRALDLLGVCLAEGIGCAPDPVAALHRFQQAVDAGNPRACYNLAVRHAKGLGTRRDETRAAEIFAVGALAGDPECMHAYGRCLESGFGVASDFEAAVAWMRKAAALGQADALAWCLRQGLSMEVASAE